MDRRMTPFSGRAALETLRGQVDAAIFTAGTPAQLIVPLADLCAKPGGARDRQVLLGDSFVVIDRDQGHAFVQAAKDGYCGWLPEAALGAQETATHWVSAPATHLYPEPRTQAPDLGTLTLGARLTVLDMSEKYAETTRGFVPVMHIKPLGSWHKDPVAVAQVMLGTPYLWGGNSRAGLDCSGLVQASLLACGIACPGDSDLQRAIGQPISEKAALKRGDLLFWKGHVAMCMNADFMIHATAAFMAVVAENTRSAIARIQKQDDSAVVARRRP